MADFSLNEFWWNKPPRTESQLPALQLGVQMVQNRARLDLAERQLADDMARTDIARTESLAKLKLQTDISAANAELARLAAQVTDFSDPAQMKPIYDLGSRFGYVVGTKGWEGIINTHERAVTAKRMAANTESLIESRQDRAELNAAIEERRALLADSTIELNDARITKLNEDIGMMEREMSVREGNLRLRGVELDQKGKRLSLRDAAAYKNELAALDREEKDVLGKTFDATEAAAKRKLYNMKRRGLVEKFYGPQAADTNTLPTITSPVTIAPTEPKTPRAGLQTNEPPVVPPQPIAPENNPRAADIRESFRRGLITKEQAAEQLRELGFK